METIRPEMASDLEGIWKDFMSKAKDIDLTFYGRVALGNVTALTVGMMWVDPEQDGDETLFVGIEGFGCYTFSNLVHWQYLKQKMKGLMDWDCQNLADFINRQLGLTGKPQGKYLPKNCGGSRPPSPP